MSSYTPAPEKALATAVIYQAVKALKRARAGDNLKRLAELDGFFLSDNFEFWAYFAMIDPDAAREALGFGPSKHE